MCRVRNGVYQTDIVPRFAYNVPLDTDADEDLSPLKSRRRMKQVHKSFIVWHVLAIAYYLSSSFCQCHEEDLVDLTHDFDNRTIYWVTEPRLELEVTYNGTRPGTNYWYQKDQFSAATHGGTHLDAPCHFAKSRWTVTEIPLSRLVMLPTAVVDMRSRVGSDPDVHMSIQDLLDWESEHGKIADGNLLLVNTGWNRFWLNEPAYSGSAGRKAEELKFPSVLAETAKWLIENRNIVGIGIDTMSIDPPNLPQDKSTHVTLMEQNIYALENVNNLDRLPPTGAIVSVAPMKLKYASGAPARIFAKLPDRAAAAVVNSGCDGNGLCSWYLCTVGFVVFAVLASL